MPLAPRFDTPRPFRQSMAWLHTWTGLLLGWLLFAIFASGSLSFFRNEIDVWMRPELHRFHAPRDDARVIANARRVLEHEAPDSRQWTIVLPGPRDPSLSLSWRVEPLAREAGTRGVRRPAHGARPEMKRLFLDPSTGEAVERRETSIGMFLFRFHFQLHGIGWFAGRWIVGIAALSMLIALVSGVVIHRAFFRDFFTFRPNKGKRTWLDAHALAGVVSLPFHLAITFSGLLLLGALLMPSVVRSAYPDASGFLVEARGGRERFNIAPPSGRRAPLADIAPMIADAEKEWRGVRAGTVVVTNPGDAAATVEVLQARADSLARRGAPHRIAFDGVSGQRIETPQAKPPSAIASVWNALTTLHLGRFATPVQRWLLFLAGLSGTLMIATGLILWRISRFKTRAPEEAPSIACRGVEILNVSAIAGWLAAIGACFWAGRLLSASLAARGDWEIRVFFLVWAAALIHAASRRHLLAWVEQLFVSGGLIASLPLANALTGGLPLYRSIVSGPWQVAGFDAFALFFGAALLFAARRLDLRRRADALAENGEEARTARP